jgi:hypothetical protein
MLRPPGGPRFNGFVHTTTGEVKVGVVPVKARVTKARASTKVNSLQLPQATRAKHHEYRVGEKTTGRIWALFSRIAAYVVPIETVIMSPTTFRSGFWCVLPAGHYRSRWDLEPEKAAHARDVGSGENDLAALLSNVPLCLIEIFNENVVCASRNL